MNIAMQRELDRRLGPSLCRLLSLWPGATVDVPPGREIRSLLVILLSEMGSLVLAQPMFRRLRQDHPGVKIHVLLFASNRPVLELMDVVPPERIITIGNTSLGAMGASSLSAIRRLRQIGVDAVIDCELFSRISSIFSRLSGAPIRVGFHPHTQEGLYRGDFINRPVLYNPYVHISRQFLTLARALTAQGRPGVKDPVDGDSPILDPISPAPRALARVRDRLRRAGSSAGDRPLVLFYPGGGLLPIRAWPLENYCRLAKALVEDGCTVATIGMAQDRDLARAITDACHGANCIDLTGATETVAELIALFHLADLLITNDGGPVHFAAATPIPAIVFYGPETPVLYGSLSPRAENIYAPVACSPCLTAYNHRNSPCDGNNVCLKRIGVGRVTTAARRILAGKGPR